MSKEVSSIQCDGCGARLKKMDGVNVNCEYCGVLIRVVGEGSEQYNIANILSQFTRLDMDRIRKDSFDKLYERVKVFIEQGKYVEASTVLNNILDEDKTQARAWFYKSLLPVLEEDTVMFRGYPINVRVISQITNRQMISMYLKDCGLPRRQHAEFMRFYGSTDFLHNQTMKFLDKAIEHASSDERRAFFKTQKETAIEYHKHNMRVQRRETMMWILLAFGVLVGATIFGVWFITNFLLE